MTTNPHEAITKMTSEEYHDFMWRARHAERERQRNRGRDMSIRDQIRFKVESIHQIQGHDCLCGFSSAVSRDRTKHIVSATLDALEEEAESAEYEYYENGQAQP